MPCDCDTKYTFPGETSVNVTPVSRQIHQVRAEWSARKPAVINSGLVPDVTVSVVDAWTSDAIALVVMVEYCAKILLVTQGTNKGH